jgi:hypothetical protein
MLRGGPTGFGDESAVIRGFLRESWDRHEGSAEYRLR